MKGMIQVAGIHDEKEARIVSKAGADFLAFPLRLPVHKEDLSESHAKTVIATIRSPGKAVLITYSNRATEISEMIKNLGVEAIQLHGDIDVDELEKLKQLVPNVKIHKALIVQRNNLGDLIHELTLLTPYVDLFVTDTFDPTTGATGATGKTHNWEISRKIVELSKRPVMLAGGLTPQNVEAAIEEVKPAGVDAHTGVEGADGRKDATLVRKFVKRARLAFGRLNKQ